MSDDRGQSSSFLSQPQPPQDPNRPLCPRCGQPGVWNPRRVHWEHQIRADRTEPNCGWYGDGPPQRQQHQTPLDQCAACHNPELLNDYSYDGYICWPCYRDHNPETEYPNHPCPDCTHPQVFDEAICDYKCKRCRYEMAYLQARPVPQGPAPPCPKCHNPQKFYEGLGVYRCKECFFSKDLQKPKALRAIPRCPDCRHPFSSRVETGQHKCFWCDEKKKAQENANLHLHPNDQRNLEDGDDEEIEEWPQMASPARIPLPRAAAKFLEPNRNGNRHGPRQALPRIQAPVEALESNQEFLDRQGQAAHVPQQNYQNLRPGPPEQNPGAPMHSPPKMPSPVDNRQTPPGSNQASSNSQSSFGGHGSRQEYLNYKDKSLNEWLKQIPRGPPRIPPGSSMVQRGQGQRPTGQASQQFFHDSLNTIQVPHGGPLIIPPTERASRQVILDSMQDPRNQNPGAMMRGTSRVYTNRHDFTNAMRNPHYQNPGYSMQVPPLRMSSTIYHRPIAPRGPNPGTRQQGPPLMSAPMYHRPTAPGSSQAYSNVQSQRPTAPRQAFQNPDQHPRGPNPGTRQQAPPQEPPAPVDQRRQAAAPGPNPSFVNARQFWIDQQQANQNQDFQAQNPRARNAPAQAPPQEPPQRRRG